MDKRDLGVAVDCAAMCRSLTLVLLMVALLPGLAACGGGAGASTASSLPMKARLLKRGEFPGFTTNAPLSVNSTKAYVGRATALTPSQRKAWIARLTREGFKQDLTEFLRGAYGAQALSGVMQLGSAASARDELAAERDSFAAEGATEFAVSTIPGAVGYDLPNGENILFADGPFQYIVGYGWYGSAHNPKHAALIKAATKLYARVHGHPAP